MSDVGTIHVPAQMPGKLPCKLAFLGEAPSDEELLKKEPLVGPSGRVFNALLRTANINRADHWVGNVFDEKLPGNSVKSWCMELKEARALGLTGADTLPPLAEGWLKPEHRWHLDRLREELEAVNPDVIVPLGGTALWALTGKTEVASHRGTPFEATRLLPGKKILATYHPAFVLKSWKFYHVVAGDLAQAAAEAEKGPAVDYQEKELWLDPTLADIATWYERYWDQIEVLSVDIETGWGQITSIAFGDDTHAIVIPIWDLRQPDRSYWRSAEQELAAWAWIKKMLESDKPKEGQNFGGYDLFWLYHDYGINVRNFLHDTRLQHHALYPELPKDLAFLAGSYARQSPWKAMRAFVKAKKDD